MSTLTPNNPNDNYLNHTKGIRSWLLTLYHKRIGIMYLICILLAFLMGGIFAMMIRFHLLTPEGTFMTQDQ